MTRTGCCGCPISHKAVADLEKIGRYEPNIVKAAWNIFGKSYEYRQKYNEYKARRMGMEKEKRRGAEQPLSNQISLFDTPPAQEEARGLM